VRAGIIGTVRHDLYQNSHRIACAQRRAVARSAQPDYHSGTDTVGTKEL